MKRKTKLISSCLVCGGQDFRPGREVIGRGAHRFGGTYGVTVRICTTCGFCHAFTQTNCGCCDELMDVEDEVCSVCEWRRRDTGRQIGSPPS